MEAKLVVIGGKANMGEVKLRLPMTIGRGNKADLMISHPTVSREHCRLFEKNGELVVQDNGSSNGTFVDGEKIDAAVVVQPGQILAIGPLTFRAEYEAPTSHVSSVTKSGPLADTQAIDSDELDLDFLLSDDAPAKPAPAKPKAEKKVEAKAPPVAPGKTAKNAPPEAKEKKSGGGAPAIQEPVKPGKAKSEAEKSPKVGPPSKEVKETAELDVDFLLDDLAEEQKQAPAAKDTSEIDFSDLGLDEPAAKSPKVAPPAAKTPAPAPKSDDFEQTIDFSGIGDDDDKPSAAAPMEDLLPNDDVKPGDIDFDFLSDLDDAKPAAAAKIDEPAKKAESGKIAPPQPEPVASLPVEEPPVASTPAAADDLDLNDFLGDLDLPAADAKSPAGTVDWEPKAEAAPAIASPEVPAPSEPAAEASFDLDDFLSDIEAAPSEQAVAPADEEPSLAAAESSAVAPPEPEAEKPEFDFSALSETQDVVIGPPVVAAVEDKTIEIIAPEVESPVAETRAEVPAEDSSSATIPDFDFLAEEEVSAVVDIAPAADVTPVVDATPVVDFTDPVKADDFSFLDDLAESPAAAAELSSPSPVEPAAEKTVDFSAFGEPAASDVKEAEAKESEEDPFAFLDAEAPPAPKVELPTAAVPADVTLEQPKDEPRSVEPAFEATLNSDALDLDAPSADVAKAPVEEAEKPAAEFDFDAFVIDEVKVEPAAAAPAAEDAAFDFLADLPKAETSPSPEAKTPADDFDFLAADDAVAPAAGLDETAMFSAAETPVVDAPTVSAESAPEFSFEQPKEPAAEVDFGSFEAVEAKADSEPAADFDMFAAPTSEPDAATEAAAESESAPITFAPAAKAAPSSPVSKKPAAKGPTFLEKIKLLFGGSKKAPAKKAGAKKSGPVAPASTTKYQPVIANPVKPVDAPIPLDDAPIPLDDFAPTDVTPADTAATEMFVGLASLEPPNAETPIADEMPGTVAFAPEIQLESSPTSEAAANIAPPVDADATAMFDAFAVDSPAAEANAETAKESADDMFGDFLSDLGASDAPSAPAETAAADPWGEAAETKPADEAAELDFHLDDVPPTTEPEVAATDEWSLESPLADSPIADSAKVEPPAADQLELDFLSEELATSSSEANAAAPEQHMLEPVAETTQEPTSETADLFAEVADAPAADVADIESVAAESPAAELATPTAPRRPAHIDVDLRMSSSLRPLARVHLQRPRHDLPEMEPEEPAGRNFTPRAKQPTPPNVEPETTTSSMTPDAFDFSGTSPESQPTMESPIAGGPTSDDVVSSDAPSFDAFDFGDDSAAPSAEAASEPVASLGDADFDFLAKEQEAEAALDVTGTAPTSETTVDPTADLFAGLEAAATPAPVEQEEEFVISLDELSEEPSPAEISPSAQVAADATPIQDVGKAPDDAGFGLDFLDLEVADESPALVDGLEVIDIVEETPPASNEDEKTASQPVAAKKAPADDDQELADFLRDLGMN